MKRPLIKICGITNYEDGRVCLEKGADMLGFIFYPGSPRFINPDKAGDIISSLRALFRFESVGVFVNPEKDYVNEVIRLTGIDMLQFHGEESSSFIKMYDKKAIKAFRIKDKNDTGACDKFKDVDYFLFDAYVKDQYGGTGQTFDWKVLKRFKYREKLFLSGGINIINLKNAIIEVQPYAIDVSSSLEEKPGKKDKFKIDEFFLYCQNLCS